MLQLANALIDFALCASLMIQCSYCHSTMAATETACVYTVVLCRVGLARATISGHSTILSALHSVFPWSASRFSTLEESFVTTAISIRLFEASCFSHQPVTADTQKNRAT